MKNKRKGEGKGEGDGEGDREGYREGEGKRLSKCGGGLIDSPLSYAPIYECLVYN